MAWAKQQLDRLRALLDSAAFSNMQGGFKLRGRVSGGEVQVNPGEFVDLDATVDDVNKAIMPLPFKEPSSAFFSLIRIYRRRRAEICQHCRFECWGRKSKCTCWLDSRTY